MSLDPSLPHPQPANPLHTESIPRQTIELFADPRPISIVLAETALLIIDPQRDFMELGGFGAALGNNPELLRKIIEPLQAVLASARERGLTVLYTREGHEADMSDCPPNKLDRWQEGSRIGDPGPLGRVLIRGEAGHEIIPELAPLPNELIIDKPGKDACYKTNLEEELRAKGINYVLVAGVTTDVCVSTTVRSLNDRGFNAIVIADCCASYCAERHLEALDAIVAQGGIFGFETQSFMLLKALRS